MRDSFCGLNLDLIWPIITFTSLPCINRSIQEPDSAHPTTCIKPEDVDHQIICMKYGVQLAKITM